MGDPLAPNIPLPLQVTTLATPPQTDVDVLTSVLLKLPQSLENLQRPVQLTGTLFPLAKEGQIALRTAAGQIEMSLEFLQGAKQNLLKDLLAPFLEKPKTLHLLIESGAPPKTAHLFLPKQPEQVFVPKQTQTPQMAATRTEQPFVKDQLIDLAPLNEAPDKGPILSEEKALATPRDASAPSVKWPSLLQAPQEKVSFLTRLLAERIKTHLPTPDNTQTHHAQPQDSARPVVLPSQARLHSLHPPEAEWPTTLPENSIKATVIGTTRSGHAVLETEGRYVVVKQTGALQTGTKIVLIPTTGQADEPLYDFPLPNDIDWKTMRQMVAALSQTDPQATANFLKTRLPSPVEYLSGTAIFLLSALQSGKIDEWLGPAIQTAIAKSGQKAALGKAIDEMTDILQSLSTDPRVGEWKAYPLPIHYGTAFEMLRLYIHEDPRQGKEEADRQKDKKQTRFIISMTMDQLGSLQLDGLSRPKQLDIIIRSENPLPPELAPDLREHYLVTLEALGLTGSILFQTGKQNWVYLEKEGSSTSHTV